ncbi:putative toxin-antitoxin system toxin component, PIN family [Candidatus Curtissbacteria bacterium]|nr:putative toxin-antitoxin system toxin component, PIN family [Candidatus Curtissbacteria bacterium]
MRVVLDTVVFVRGLIKPTNACGRTIFVHGERFQLVVSKEILTEILEVLGRPEIESKFSPNAAVDFRKLLDFLSRAFAVELEDIPNVSRDVKDDMFLATALAGQADYLVSEDEDLLVVGKYQGVKIVNCRQFADILEAKRSR